jgi:hypothetical protein
VVREQPFDFYEEYEVKTNPTFFFNCIFETNSFFSLFMHTLLKNEGNKHHLGIKCSFKFRSCLFCLATNSTGFLLTANGYVCDTTVNRQAMCVLYQRYTQKQVSHPLIYYWLYASPPCQCFCFVFVSSCVPFVASFSGLSIFDCTLGIL